MEKKVIKNIFWDVDGVLANLNYAYFNFLTNHPKYAPKYKDMKWEDLPKVLPIVPKYGALELKTHPEMGVDMDKDFCYSPEFFTNRPLYPNVIETLKELHQKGYKLGIISNNIDEDVKHIITREGIGDLFETVVCSSTVGERKPSAKIFLR